MKLKPFGYMLGTDYLIILEKSTLIHLGSIKNKPVYIRPTMFRLLIYLIENASTEPIIDEDIMRNVWEKHDLRASKARLWQVMNAMCKKLSLTDSFCDLFKRVENTGYLVNEVNIRAIYSNDQRVEKGKSYATERSLS